MQSHPVSLRLPVRNLSFTVVRTASQRDKGTKRVRHKADYPEYYCPDCWNNGQVKTIMQPVENPSGAFEDYYCPIHKKEFASKNLAEFDDHYLVGGDLDTINSA